MFTWKEEGRSSIQKQKWEEEEAAEAIMATSIEQWKTMRGTKKGVGVMEKMSLPPWKLLPKGFSLLEYWWIIISLILYAFLT